MRVLLSTIGSRGDVQPLVALASQLRALGQEVRLCVPPDFREWIEQPRHPRRAHRSRGAQDRRPPAHRPRRPLCARAPPSAGGRHGRHAVRDDHGGSPRLRRHRGGNRPANRRSLGRREDGNPLRLRRLLPERSAIATPCAAPIAACAGTDAGTRNGRQPRALGSGRGTLQRPVRPRAQLPSGINRPGPGHRRAQPHLHRPALAGRRPHVGALARSRGPGRVSDGRLDPAG